MNNLFIIISMLIVALMFFSCEKFLDEKSSQSLVIPSTLEDYLAILDNVQQINFGAYPSQLEMVTDDYEVDYSFHSYLSESELDLYKWQKDYQYSKSDINTMWKNPYKVIFLANTVLDGLVKFNKNSIDLINNLKGIALFHRGFSHFMLSQVYCEPYDKINASDKLGLPLRLTSDFNQKSERYNLEETYASIIDDLKNAVTLLPINVEYTTRPSKVAAYAALARVYLYMEDYNKAERYADTVLSFNASLIDFNTLDQSARWSFERFNKETLYFGYSNGSTILSTSIARISQDLMDYYEDDDLRKSIYFFEENEDSYSFKGSMIGNSGSAYFVGLTVSEIILISTESKIRNGKEDQAKELLQRLLRKRFPLGIDLTVTKTGDDFLKFVLDERRRELPFRGLRWLDLRRLNKDPRFKRELVRIISTPNGEEHYTLQPDDEWYIFDLPQSVIDITGMNQNPRK